MESKILTIAIIFTFLSFSVYGQTLATDSLPPKVQHWKYGGSFNLNFNQVGLSNWVGGGQSSVATGFILDLFGKYENKDMVWDNKFRGSYGLMRIGERSFPTRKTDDILDIQSRYSRKVNKHFSISGIVHYWTQFDDGYAYQRVQGSDEETRSLLSQFMAPGFLQALIGYTYQREGLLSVTLSPLSGKFTFVMHDSLSNAGAYGVDPGEKMRFEGGASGVVQLRKELTENISVQTSLNLFQSYTFRDPLDVNWETLLKMRVHKNISTTISTHLIYDNDISTDVQFKHVLNVGFEYKFL